MTPQQRLAKADFVSGIVLVALGLAVVGFALAMPRYEHLNINPYSVPGLVPGLLGAVLTLLGAILLIRAVRRGGWRLGDRDTAIAPLLIGAESPRNLPVLLLLTIGYAAFLVGWLPFWLATFVFTFAFVLFFGGETGAGGIGRRTAIAAVLAAGTALAIPYVFEEIFLVQLP